MLADQYRPTRWQDVAGNDRAIEKVADLTARALDSRAPLALLLSGPSGVGKSTVARLVARTVGADPDWDTRHVPAGKCTAETVRDIETWFSHATLFGSGWKVAIVEEVDRAGATARGLWLTLLETMPPRRAVVFTSNTRPGELFGGISAPFVSRTYPVWFTSQGLATCDGKPGPGAERVKWIAQQEGINSKPDSYYVGLVQQCRGNIRAAIHKMEMES